ncbi:SRPBCC domain-containing protein [Rossellomorea vietnamensis]|uniref:SRPBCC domain-containing protein n=1 Tax=Rossellomorea vietnamensis TaxID=218284 RepID=A0ACD4CEK5_9BACI|nr:SRPBCC domain-containing protein [Rossellomorea vietnamensis]UXH46854.1 SRPBCC domain-containing protein [Rossellomorea vietnamensis]
MNNITQMKIQKPAHDIFEAFVDPEMIGNFWFSSSSERWKEGKTVTLRYEEYDAQGDIHILEIQEEKKIVFEWAGNHKVTISFTEETGSTIVGVKEEGFDEESENIINELVDNKEGWVYMLTCLKGYMEYGVNLRASLVK